MKNADTSEADEMRPAAQKRRTYRRMEDGLDERAEAAKMELLVDAGSRLLAIRNGPRTSIQIAKMMDE